MKLLICLLSAAPLIAQGFGGPVSSRRVKNNACAEGQIPTYDAEKRLTGCASAGAGGGDTTVQAGGTAVGTRPTINFINSPGWVWAPVDDPANNRVNIGGAPDSAVFADRDTAASAVDIVCIDSSGSTTAKTCSPVNNTGPGGVVGKALAAYTNGMHLPFRSTSACSGATTLAVSALPARRLFAADGTSNPACEAGRTYGLYYNATLDGGAGGWVFPAGGGSSLPSQSGQSGNFLGTDGNAAAWTVPMFRQLPPPPTSWTSYNAGGLTINTSLPGRTVLSSTADAIQGVYKSISGNFDQIFSVYSIMKGGVNTSVGVFLTDGTKLSNCVVVWSSGNNGFQWVGENMNTSSSFSGFISITSAGVVDAAGGMGPVGQRLMYFRLRDDGTNTSCQYSPDGYEWQVVWTRASGTFLTPTGAGVAVRSPSASGVLTKAIIMGAN